MTLAWGAMAIANCATASPARCISMWGGSSVAALASSVRDWALVKRGRAYIAGPAPPAPRMRSELVGFSFARQPDIHPLRNVGVVLQCVFESLLKRIVTTGGFVVRAKQDLCICLLGACDT